MPPNQSCSPLGSSPWLSSRHRGTSPETSLDSYTCLRLKRLSANTSWAGRICRAIRWAEQKHISLLGGKFPHCVDGRIADTGHVPLGSSPSHRMPAFSSFGVHVMAAHHIHIPLPVAAHREATRGYLFIYRVALVHSPRLGASEGSLSLEPWHCLSLSGSIAAHGRRAIIAGA